MNIHSHTYKCTYTPCFYSNYSINDSDNLSYIISVYTIINYYSNITQNKKELLELLLYYYYRTIIIINNVLT